MMTLAHCDYCQTKTPIHSGFIGGLPDDYTARQCQHCKSLWFEKWEGDDDTGHYVRAPNTDPVYNLGHR